MILPTLGALNRRPAPNSLGDADRRRRARHWAPVLALLAAIPLLGVPRGALAADVGEGANAPQGSPPSSPVLQAEDRDKPRDQSLLDKNAADAALAAKKQEEGPPFYKRWQVWAVAGGVVVAIVAAVIVVPKIAHQINGGDVQPCNPTFFTCVGAGH